MSTDQAQRLTAKQDKFAYFLAVTGVVEDAARRAGYAESTVRSDAHSFPAIPSIASAVERYKAQLAQESAQFKLSPEDVMAGLAKEARTADTASARVSAWRTLADILGMTQGNARELPDALNSMLEAVARGLAAGSKQASLPTGQVVEASAREVADLNGES